MARRRGQARPQQGSLRQKFRGDQGDQGVYPRVYIGSYRSTPDDRAAREGVYIQHHHGDNRKYRQCRRQACYAVRDERPKAGDRDAPHLIRRHDPAGFSRAIRGDTRPLPGSDGAIFRHEFFAYRRSKSIRRRPQTRDPRAHRTVQQSLRRHDHKIPKRRGDRRYGKHFYQADGDDLHEETLALKRKR